MISQKLQNKPDREELKMEHLSKKNRIKGMFMVLVGASLWGISGTVAQVLFQQKGFQAGWLVSVRLLFSGALLLSLAALRKRKGGIWGVWKDPRDRSGILVFGLVGLLGVQYSYFAAV